ncbi:MAG: hypothetical protein AB7T63_12895 [Planctomycetota bacterium]
MPRPRTLLVLVALAAPWLPDVPRAAARPEASHGPWRAGPHEFLHYALDLERHGSEDDPDQGLPEPFRSTLGFFGYELALGERPLRALQDEESLLLPYVFWAPRPALTAGGARDIAETLTPYGRQHGSLRAVGKISGRAGDGEGLVRLRGAVAFDVRPHALWETDAGGRRGGGLLTWTSTFDVDAGQLVEARFDLSVDRATGATRPNGSAVPFGSRLVMQGRVRFVRRFPHRYAGFEADVGKAIDRGLQALRRRRDPDGSWSSSSPYAVGQTALGVLATTKGGIGRTPEIEPSVAWLLEHEATTTYEAGLLLAALESLAAPVAELGRGERRADATHGTRAVEPRELAVAERTVRFLLEAGHGPGDEDASGPMPRGRPRRATTGNDEPLRWGYPGGHMGRGRPLRGGPRGGDRAGYWDNSNSQLAVLGLHAGQLLGVKVPTSTWRRVIAHFLQEQRAAGPSRRGFVLEDAHDDTPRYGTGSRYAQDIQARGWGYSWLGNDHERPVTSTYGSMTCAGISSLAIADGALARTKAPGYGGADRQRVLDAIRDGFASLDEQWASWGNPNQGRYYYLYYLYGLERASMLTGVRWIGDHDWYWEGAVHLLLMQDDDGTWERDTVETAMAVLFLKRGTQAVITPR